MPRKRKTPEADGAQANGSGAPATESSATEGAPKKKRAPRRRKASAPKASATSVPAAPVQISDEAIRLRAYFIAEQRLRNAMPGDAESDWVEARRQLIAEQSSR